MPISAGICTSYKTDILKGIHLANHVYKVALFTSGASLDVSTTTYSGAAGECTGVGYATGGIVLTGFSVSSSGAVAWLTFDNATWTNITVTARGALVYNSTLTGKNAVCVIDFGSDMVSSNEPFTINMPSADPTNALIRLT